MILFKTKSGSMYIINEDDKTLRKEGDSEIMEYTSIPVPPMTGDRAVFFLNVFRDNGDQKYITTSEVVDSEWIDYDL